MFYRCVTIGRAHLDVFVNIVLFFVIFVDIRDTPLHSENAKNNLC